MKTAAAVTVAVITGLLILAGALALRAPQARAEEGAPGATGLQILPADSGGVWICWDPVDGARYQVLRAAFVGGPYEPVSGLLEEAEFLDREAPEAGAFYRVEIVVPEAPDRLRAGEEETDAPAADTAELVQTLETLHRQGDYQQAANLASAFLISHPDRDLARQQIHYLYARALVWLQDYGLAKAELETLLADYAAHGLDPTLEEVMVDDAQYLLGWIELHRGDPVKAHADLMALADGSPGSNRTADALFLANRALIDHVDNRARRMREPAFYDAPIVDMQEQIRANVERVVSLDPSSPRAPQMLADYLIYLVRRPRSETAAEMIAVAERILADYPGTAAAETAIEELTDAKILWGDEQDRTEAGATLDGLIAAAEAHGMADRVLHWSYYKAKLLRRQNDLEAAEDLIVRCLRRDPGFLPYEFRLQLAFVYKEQGRVAEAIDLLRDMQAAYASDPEKESLARFLAALYEASLGRTEEAAHQMAAITEEYAGTSTAEAARRQAELLVRRSRAR